MARALSPNDELKRLHAIHVETVESRFAGKTMYYVQAILITKEDEVVSKTIYGVRSKAKAEAIREFVADAAHSKGGVLDILNMIHSVHLMYVNSLMEGIDSGSGNA